MCKNKEGNVLYCAEPRRCGVIGPGRELRLANAVDACSIYSHRLEHTSLSLGCVVNRGRIRAPSSRAPSPSPAKRQLSVLQAQPHPATQPPPCLHFLFFHFLSRDQKQGVLGPRIWPWSAKTGCVRARLAGTEQAFAKGWMLELRVYQEATRDANLCQPHPS